MARPIAADVVFLTLFSFNCLAQNDAVVVTATRVPEHALSSPVGMSVIGAQAIQDSMAQSLPQLLSQEAGIVIRDVTGSPDLQVDLRGFGAGADQNTLILVDGRRLNEIELVNVRWSSIPLSSIERIEITRGSGAVLHGGGATGGTINIITRSVRPSTRAATLKAMTGGLGYRETGASLNVAGEKLGIMLAANNQSANNFRENNRLDQQNIEGELRFVEGAAEVALKFGLENQKLGLPGARTQAQLATDPRGASTPRDFLTRDGNRLGLAGSLKLGVVELSADAFVRDSVRTSSQKDYFFGGLFDVYLDTRSRVKSFSPRMKIPFELSGFRSQLLVGLDAEDWEYLSRRAASFERLEAPTARVVAGQRNRAVFIQNNTDLGGDTKLTLGLRHQRVRMNAQDSMNAAAYASGAKLSSPKAWEVAVHHNLASSSVVYAKAGQSFRISTVDESYNQFGGPVGDAIVTLLEPQISRDHEIGYEYRNSMGRLRVSTYLNDLKNEIHFFAPSFSNINLPPTRRKGLELEGRMTLTKALGISANVSFVSARFRDGVIAGTSVKGKAIPLVPEYTANFGMSWNISDMTRAGVMLNHVGRQRFDNDQANTFPGMMPSYETVGINLSHKMKALTLRASVANLLDESYFSYAIRNAAGTSFNAYPQPGRTFRLALEWSL